MKTEHAYTDAAQRREEEIREHISWFREFLTFGTELPETIRRQYGLEEDYRRYMELEERDNRMFEEADGTEYRRHMEKIRKGEIPGPGKAYGKVVLAVEKAYRELDARFCRMTGKKPDADRLFGKSTAQKAVPAQREASESNTREVRMHKRGGRRPGF